MLYASAENRDWGVGRIEPRSSSSSEKKDSTKTQAREQKQGTEKAVGPVKSRVDSFSQLVCLCNSQTLREPLQRQGETARKTAEI